MREAWQIGIDDYRPLIGEEVVARIVRKANRLRGLRVVHVSSTFYGGGVAEMLSSATLLERRLGLVSDWRLIQGSPDFFSVTKKLHNALQGADVALTDANRRVYEEIILQNSLRMDLDADVVVVHDPQPLPLIRHERRRCPWVWRGHIELSRPNPDAWGYVRGLVDEYDAVVLSLPEYAQELRAPQVFITPGIDPFALKNRALEDAEIDARLRRYDIPRDLPLVVQVSRFDRWKDPEGVIAAFGAAARAVPGTLVLLGNVATDDPEGQEVFEAVIRKKSERVRILTAEDSLFVNALQRCAAVVLQMSLREGFGLTVTEAMWKGALVVARGAGGIRRQIEDGWNGLLVESPEHAAECIVRALRDRTLREKLGPQARATVRERFLLSRVVEDHLDLYGAFEPRFRLDVARLPALTQRVAMRGHDAAGDAAGNDAAMPPVAAPG